MPPRGVCVTWTASTPQGSVGSTDFLLWLRYPTFRLRTRPGLVPALGLSPLATSWQPPQPCRCQSRAWESRKNWDSLTECGQISRSLAHGIVTPASDSMQGPPLTSLPHEALRGRYIRRLEATLTCQPPSNW